MTDAWYISQGWSLTSDVPSSQIPERIVRLGKQHQHWQDQQRQLKEPSSRPEEYSLRQGDRYSGVQDGCVTNSPITHCDPQSRPIDRILPVSAIHAPLDTTDVQAVVAARSSALLAEHTLVQQQQQQQKNDPKKTSDLQNLIAIVGTAAAPSLDGSADAWWHHVQSHRQQPRHQKYSYHKNFPFYDWSVGTAQQAEKSQN